MAKLKIGKTGASCILCESPAPQFLQQMVDIMKTNFYSLSTDGSSDTRLKKMNPLTVRPFDINTSMVDTRFLDIRCSTGQTSHATAAIFQKMDDVMTKLQLPWSNYIGF